MRLYEQGLNDRAIATGVKLSVSTVQKWRAKYSLVSNVVNGNHKRRRMELNAKYAKMVKDYRLSLHESQTEFGRRYNRDAAEICFYETNRRYVPKDIIDDVVKYYDGNRI